jgi:hypothetical protein
MELLMEEHAVAYEKSILHLRNNIPFSKSSNRIMSLNSTNSTMTLKHSCDEDGKNYNKKRMN